ncbi:MAG: O-methyltransferase [Flavobacteriales bacterium]|nr:O-methyltransferase [Flavobacteriales bacterium]
MHFSPEKYAVLEQYAEDHSTPHSPLLAQLVRATWQRSTQPRMISDAFQGRILSMISKMIAPKRILELGTFTGYSALCLAEGLTEGGELITVDKNEELEDFATSFFEKSHYGEKIKMKIGKALDVIPTLGGEFDLVFIDADKCNYVNYIKMIIPMVRHGGVILSDNVLWSGKVVEPLKPKDTDTAVILEYNKILATDQRVETILLPIRDGLTITRKK